MMIRSPLFQISIETGWITPLQILQVYCAVYWWHPGESGGPTPILLLCFTKLCCTLSPQEVSNGEQIARPEDVIGDPAGNGADHHQQRAKARTKRIFNHKLHRKVCWRLSDDDLFDVLHSIYPSRSVYL